MANSVIQGIKRALIGRYPEWVGAYHQARYDARARRHARTRSPVATAIGFRFEGPQGMEEGTFEPQETAFLAQRLQGTDVFVDVGANAGYFVCLARQHGKRVVAVEPSARNLELLFRNLASNGWDDVEVFPVGLAEKPGLAKLYGDGTGASLVTRWAGVSEAWQRTIPLTTMDVLLGGRFESERLLIKVDVEGAEHGVLAGARDTLARRVAPVWLVEVCFTENFPNGEVNPSFRAVFELFWGHGYTARSLEAGRCVTPGDVSRWIETGRREFGYVSYIFEKAE